MKPLEARYGVRPAQRRHGRRGAAAVLAAVVTLGAGAPAVAQTERGTITGYPLDEVVVREANGQSRSFVTPDALPPVGTQVDVRPDGGVLIPGENGAYIDSTFVDVTRAGNDLCVGIKGSDVAMGKTSATQAGSPGIDGGCR